MANIQSARKRVRTTQRRTDINKQRLSRIRTQVKKVEAAIAASDAASATQALKLVTPEMMRGVAKGVIKKNTMARKLSRLTRHINTISAAK